MTNFGEFIKKQRERLGWTQTEFGAKLGINSSAISRIENNSKQLSYRKLENLSKICDLNFQELKELYFANKFAQEAIKYDCPNTTFTVAEKTLIYLKSKNVRQLKIDVQ